MIRIANTAEAFEAISRTLPLGSVGFEHERTASRLARPKRRRQAGGAARTAEELEPRNVCLVWTAVERQRRTSAPEKIEDHCNSDGSGGNTREPAQSLSPRNDLFD
jgi:hypothetical protein